MTDRDMYIRQQQNNKTSGSKLNQIICGAKNTRKVLTANMNTLAVLLAALAIVIQIVSAQEDLHSSSDSSGVDGGSKQRTIYSQKHLSPHRMMHFGKRPLILMPPSMAVPIQSFSDPTSFRGAQFRSREDPYMYSFDTLQGRRLQEIPTDRDVDFSADPLFGENILLGYGAQSGATRMMQPDSSRLQDAQYGQRLMRLIAAGSIDEESQNNEDQKNNNDGQQTSPNRQSQSSDDATINVSSRSVPMTRPTAYGSPKSYISRLLFGQPMHIQQNGMSVQSGFNKKAEPKSNLFMHFG